MLEEMAMRQGVRIYLCERCVELHGEAFAWRLMQSGMSGARVIETSDGPKRLCEDCCLAVTGSRRNYLSEMFGEVVGQLAAKRERAVMEAIFGV